MQKTIDIVRIPATFLGGLGLISAFYIHINASDFATISREQDSPAFLYQGFLLLALCSVIVVILRSKQISITEPKPLSQAKLYYLSLFGDTPIYILAIAIVTFLYSNYYGLMLASHEGMTEIIDGKLVLFNHGIVRELTEIEFLQYKTNEIKMDTAKVMMLYGISSAILFPRLKQIE